MTENQINHQPNLFDQISESAAIETILLYALGEFQARGKILANRELALDRLRGAFKRASEKFAVEEFSDEEIAKTLGKLGSKVVEVPSFVAKHPFRVTIPLVVAEKAEKFYAEVLIREKLA